MITNKIILEYIWIDAVGELRSKNKVVFPDEFDIVDGRIPNWSFDGSSTGQSSGSISDIILKPIRAFKNPFIKYAESFLVLCECYEKCGKIPAKNNNRAECEKYAYTDENGCLFGIEQEYVIFDREKNIPYRWAEFNNPGIGGQGPYYCSVGGDRAFGRHVVDEHLQLCLDAGLKICGTNAEVMASQWEFQIGPCEPRSVCDELWIARYILHRITEKYNCYVSFAPKPYGKLWNGSGAHTNFSTWKMREPHGYSHIIEACEKLRDTHDECMAVYGKDNERRLTGTHETSSLNVFSYSVGNRSSSIRIPLHVANYQCGYLEDRRPAANMDPYLVVAAIMKSILTDSSTTSSYVSEDSGYDSYS